MPLSPRENYLRALQFQGPEWIPVDFGFAPATWKKYRTDLESIVLNHPIIFPGRTKGEINFDDMGKEAAIREPDGPSFRKVGDYYRDGWGCLWHCAHEGLGGQVVEHPLEDWSAMENFQPLDILNKTRWGFDREDWNVIKDRIAAARKKGFLTSARIPCFFDRLHYLRGFENLLCDFASDPPELSKLIEMVLNTNMTLIPKLLELGTDVIDHHGDIGTQRGLMVSPQTFRKYLKPGYTRMFAPFRKAGIPIRYSSDGNLLEIIDDLIECGVSSHDPQISVNTLDGIIKAYRGRLCAIVDFGQEIVLLSPQEIKEYIREITQKLGTPQGGLALRLWALPDVPLENVEAFCTAAEQFCFKRK